MNPKATIYMENGAKIVIELLPELAPNTVNSFISLASKGVMDHHAIQRIVPGKWVDVTYTAFGKDEAKYCIPWEYELHPELKEKALYSAPGYVCMGGQPGEFETGDYAEVTAEVDWKFRKEYRGRGPVFRVKELKHSPAIENDMVYFN